MLAVPSLLINTLALIGLLTTGWAISFAIKNGISYIKFKEFPTTLQEEKLLLLKEENKRLSNRLSQVQSENDEMTRAVLQRIS